MLAAVADIDRGIRMLPVAVMFVMLVGNMGLVFIVVVGVFIVVASCSSAS